MAGKLRLGVCTEAFGRFNQELAQGPSTSLDHAGMCAALAAQGWDFLELAPAGFDPVESLTSFSTSRRVALANEARKAGVPYERAHWLMSFTPHVLTSPDVLTRLGGARFLQYLAGALGEMEVKQVVYGSPPSRLVEGPVLDQHYKWFGETVASAMPAFESAGIEFLFEWLSGRETLFGNCPNDARRVNAYIAHKNASRWHFDIKAASWLVGPIDRVCELLVAEAAQVGHIHFNDANGSYPGYGSVDCRPGTGEVTDFRPVFRALRKIDYQGSASVEMFCFFKGVPGYPATDPLAMFDQSIRYLRNCEAEVQAEAA